MLAFVLLPLVFLLLFVLPSLAGVAVGWMISGSWVGLAVLPVWIPLSWWALWTLWDFVTEALSWWCARELRLESRRRYEEDYRRQVQRMGWELAREFDRRVIEDLLSGGT